MKTLKEITRKNIEDLFNINLDEVIIETDLPWKHFIWKNNEEIIEIYKTIIDNSKIKVWITKTKNNFLWKSFVYLQLKRS